MPTNRVDIKGLSSPAAGKAGATGALRWHFAPISGELQAAVSQVPWNDLASCQFAQRVKVAENRDVWRIDLAGKTIYAKCYRGGNLVKRVMERLRGLAAKREWRALRQASKVGVAAPDPLGYARADGSAGDAAAYDAILVTAAMPADALSMEEAWLQVTADPTAAGRQRKQRLIQALAELIAKAHAGGLFHRDLHVNNILIFRNGHGPKAAMIDLHNAKLCRSKGLNLAGVRSNLVQLNQWFARHAGRTDRLRFLKAYCTYLRDVLPAPQQATEVYGHKAFAMHVLNRSHSYAAGLYRKRDRRILKRNKYFATLRLTAGWEARVALEIKHGRPYVHGLNGLPSKKEWMALLKDPAGLIERLSGSVCKRAGNEEIVGADLALDGYRWAVSVKQDRTTSWVGQVRRILGTERLCSEFVIGWKCLHRELPVALPLAILRRGRGADRESILVVEQLPESRGLDAFGAVQLGEMSREQARLAKRRICHELSQGLRRMWSCKLAHHDLRAANICVQVPDGDLNRLRIVLADVNNIRKVRWGARGALLRSLARLDASLTRCTAFTRTDRLRLLLAVLCGVDRGGPDWRPAWRRVARMSMRDRTTITRAVPWLQPVVGAPAVQ